jgi:Lipopolysaccharide-assembly
VAVLAALLCGGCPYGFAGGGLPSNIRTVAILPFDNLTAEPQLTQEVSDALREAVQGRLGLRPASEANADAVVRGTILRYEPDIALSFQPGQTGNVAVTSRRVQLTLKVEIYDQREGRALWSRESMVVDGEYEPPREADGRKKALDKLVTDIVDGAQSQW